jgi:aquaporin Z
MRRYVTEFIGTFALVLTVGCTVLQKLDLAPLAIGASLMVMIFAGGHISGAHYNPAVSLAVFLRGKLPAKDLLPYWAAQIAGAAAAAGCAIVIVDPPARHPSKLTGHALGSALLAEFLFTFFLAYVVLNVATSKDTDGNSFYGLAIGFTVLTGAVAVGGISGGAFNPAVAFGASVMGLINWANIWIYLLGCLGGGGLAALTFTFLNPHDKATA